MNHESSRPTHKTVIIGAGPGGASAAIYLARFNHEAVLLDASKKVTGRTAWALHLENVLGFTEPTPGPEFLKNVYKQLKKFGVERVEDQVLGVERKGDGTFLVRTAGGKERAAEYVIVAVGVHDIMPDIDSIQDFFGHSIFQCPTCNWYQTKDRKTGIIANTDAGITTALVFNSMQEGSASYVVPDRPGATFSPEMIEKAEKAGIKVYDCAIVRLNGKDGMLDSVTLADGTEVEADILYTKLGTKRQDTFLDTSSLELERNQEGYMKVDFKTFETSVPNLFAVGPCNSGQDQVVVAAGQGASAAMEIHEKILEAKGL